MKIKLYLIATGLTLAFVLMGCGKSKLETENDGLKSDLAKLKSDDSQIKTELAQTESTNSELKAEIENFKLENSELKAKTSSLTEINSLLQKQLDSATSQIQQQTELKKFVDEVETNRPAQVAIQSMRRMESFVSTPLSADEYRQKLQDLKVTLDEQAAQITNESIKEKLQFAYIQYETAYTIMNWGATPLDASFEDGKTSIAAAFVKAGVAVPNDNEVALTRSTAVMRNFFLNEFWGRAKNAVNEAEELIKN